MGVAAVLGLSAAAVNLLFRADSSSMVWVSPFGGDVSSGTGAVLDALGNGALVVPWLGVAAILAWRWRRSRGAARRGALVLAGAAGLVALRLSPASYP